ncbi:ATP phosphoribosyltransferase [Kamptonema cortianum]|nr:ATP phosphoribosyltransferase [Geitlerinema splendidum]MDK3161012.1 ATP phosphoribosyltransferase [Kamptonema cortianum]
MSLRLGLPKGSLQDATFSLFERAGFALRVASRSYHPVIDDDAIEPVLLRPQEIPRYLEDGLIDAGLTGYDWIQDCGADVHEICELRYSKLTSNPIRVVLAVHNDSPYQRAEDLAGKSIATEYVRLTNRYFESKSTPVKVDFSWGACEVKVPELVEGIVVNTETGSSLRAHNLRIIETILTSTTRFVCNHSAWNNPEKRVQLENLGVLLTGAINASQLVGLKLNVSKENMEEVRALLPALKNPTISPLADNGWVAMEVILSEKESRDLIPALKRAGATGLVEYPLNKVIY